MRSLTQKIGLIVAIILVAVGSGGTFIAAHRLQSETPAEINLPDLTGPYKVGRTSYEWVDQSRDEKYASIPGLKRDLMVDIWFPAVPGKHSKIAPYMETAAMWDMVSNHPDMAGIVHPHAYMTETVADDKPSYPVLIFEPQTGITSFNYTSIIEELASHGYIVVGMSHPFNTSVISFPDGRYITERSSGVARPSGMEDEAVKMVLGQDVHFVIDQVEQLNVSDNNFKGRIDLDRIGMLGHFYGGLISVLSTASDPRIKAGASLEIDPMMQMASPNKPFLYIGVGAAPQKSQQTKDSYWVYSNHMTIGSFGDFGWLNSYQSLDPDEKYSGDLAPARNLQIINSYLLAFFDHYLGGAELKWPSYDEAKFVAFPMTN
jgi:hypothetical protein